MNLKNKKQTNSLQTKIAVKSVENTEKWYVVILAPKFITLSALKWKIFLKDNGVVWNVYRNYQTKDKLEAELKRWENLCD